MATRCLAAYTAPGTRYPPYLSINTDDGKTVSITVRSPANPDGSCGNNATISMGLEEFCRVLRDASESV